MDVCPICLEGDDLFTLECSHTLHLECAEGLTGLSCPICRAELTNIPESLREIIILNTEERKKELIEEEQQELLRNMRQEAIENIVISPEAERLAAYAYLMEQGIPSIYYPSGINLENSPWMSLPPGTIFQLIVDQTFANMKTAIDEYEKEYIGDFADLDDTEDDESNSENPFEPESVNLGLLERNININHRWG